ncbi:phosphatidate cytidylyltransferase [Limibacter armeniacum]|uniref:phosphatidate cytidylyltransferase n=1 Tax=Limibacter armeniacum TaxID=466084 RepID=UPI002FE58AEA
MLNLNKYSELTQRVVAGLIGGLVIVAGISYSVWTYFFVFLAICIFTMQEFYRLLGLDGNLPLKTYGTLLGTMLFVVTFLVEKGIFDFYYMYLTFVGFSTVYLVKLYKKDDKKPFINIALTFLGIAYVALPISLINAASFFENEYHFEIPLGLICILWASDTGAYFSGKTFGKRKLFERVSPKKTWEGSIGGTILAVIVSLVFAQFFDTLATWMWVIFALIIVIMGTYGDLVESLFKRSIHIKDSGRSIPGHGGFLDRFDGLLLAAPFIAAFLHLFPLTR